MNDKRLIDANALKSKIDYFDCHACGDECNIEFVSADDLEAAPTIDAVEVVRCRDCKHAIVNQNHIDKPLICCKTKMVGTTDPDWFCAAGERKMDGGAQC